MLDFSQPAANQRLIKIKNTGEHKAPPHGILQVFGMVFNENAQNWICQVGRPTQDNAKLFIINGPTELEVDEETTGSWDWPNWVLYDPADGTPALDEVWGVAAGTFKARKDKRGLVIIPAEFEDETAVEDVTYALLEYCRP